MEELGTCRSWVSGKFEHFIPTSSTAVSRMSPSASGEHEEPVLNVKNSLANLVFIRLLKSSCLRHTFSACFFFFFPFLCEGLPAHSCKDSLTCYS